MSKPRGFCKECNIWVFLKEDGSCEFGHSAESITKKLIPSQQLKKESESKDKEKSEKNANEDSVEPLTKKCTFCAEEILADALKCKHCGEWSVKQLTEAQKIQSIVQQYSNAQAPWRLVLLSILTFGFYEIYWFYRNWEHIKIHKNLDISPDWRTVGLFVPIYNIVLIYRQFRDIRNLAIETGCKTYSSPGWITFGYIYLSTVTGYAYLEGDLILPLVTSLLAVWLLVVIQRTLNDYWEKEQPRLEMRTKFSNGEIVLLVIGGIFWILSIYTIGTFIPE